MGIRINPEDAWHDKCSKCGKVITHEYSSAEAANERPRICQSCYDKKKSGIKENNMNKLPIKLLEYLVRQCTREVLNQISEEQKLKVKFPKKNEKPEEIPIKHKISVAGGKKTKFEKKIKKLSEGEEENPSDTQPAPQDGQSGGSTTPPKTKDPDPDPESQTPEQPTQQQSNGPVVINPRDKSNNRMAKY